MCGVLGIAIKNYNEGDYDLVRSLFIQSMIRGKHATGISYVKHGKVVTIKDPIPADEWIKQQDLESWKNEDGNLYCVGHIRYSTSDLRFNQPMATEKIGIVHNGVISQEPRDSWEAEYNLRTETSNDSELILRAMEKEINPLEYFTPASMAVCTVRDDKKLSAFRNEERPLYFGAHDDKIIFASTADILKRSGLKEITKLPMYRIVTVDGFSISGYNMKIDNKEDLQ